MKFVNGIAVLCVVLGTMGSLRAQVMTPMELSDPKAQHLQQRHLKTLMAIGTEIEAHKFPYPFYFSRVLDVDCGQDATGRPALHPLRHLQGSNCAGDHRKLLRRLFGGPHGLLRAIEGNLSERLSCRCCKLEAPHFPDDSEFSAFAIEVSHHVRQKVMGVSSEQPENVTVIIPVPVAQKLVDAKTDDQKQAAILEAKVFLNGQPYSLWLQEGAPSEEWKERFRPCPRQEAAGRDGKRRAESNRIDQSVSLGQLDEDVADAHADLHSGSLWRNLQRQNEDAIARMTKDLDKKAHFLPYAAPTFIGFRQGAYLQLSITTNLNAAAGNVSLQTGGPGIRRAHFSSGTRRY